MRILRTVADVRAELRARGGTVGFAPTMGYLHEGHLTLFRRARAENDVAVVSIFVNPTQFGPGEDLERYPRDPEGDLEKCRSCGVDVVWMPGVEDMYRPDATTTVRVGGLTQHLCGAHRPVHFEGVATVVTKLFHVVGPTRAYFGEKDFQQLAVVRRLVRDLDLDIDIVGVPTVREEDGLAMSSRNRFLSAEERARALGIHAALQAARASWRGGAPSADAVRSAMLDAVARVGTVDYAEICDPDSLAALVGDAGGPAVALVAVRVGETRLIDNLRLDR